MPPANACLLFRHRTALFMWNALESISLYRKSIIRTEILCVGFEIKSRFLYAQYTFMLHKICDISIQLVRYRACVAVYTLSAYIDAYTLFRAHNANWSDSHFKCTESIPNTFILIVEVKECDEIYLSHRAHKIEGGFCGKTKVCAYVLSMKLARHRTVMLCVLNCVP